MPEDLALYLPRLWHVSSNLVVRTCAGLRPRDREYVSAAGQGGVIAAGGVSESSVCGIFGGAGGPMGYGGRAWTG